MRLFPLTGIIALGLCLALGAGCAGTRSASFAGGTLEPGSGTVRAHVRESGFHFRFQLTVEGCQGQEVPIQVFGPADEFLGQELAVPGYPATFWEEFRIFLPTSRIGRLYDGDQVQVFARDPDNPDRYLGSASYTFNGSAPSQVWELLALSEETWLSAGEQGVRIELGLLVSGHQGETLPLVLVFEDLRGADIPDPQGGALRMEPMRLSCAYEGSVWNSLIVEIPYSRLAHLDRGSSVVVRPALRYPDGLSKGNLSLSLYAGGTLRTLTEQLQAQEQRLDAEIESLERQLAALGIGGR